MRLLLGLVLLATMAGVARAQDDWSVKRNPFDRRVVEKWKRVLERDPEDAAAWRTLTDLYRRHSSLEKLTAEYDDAEQRKPTYATAMILGRLAEAKDAEAALTFYAKAATRRVDTPAPHLRRAEILKRLSRPKDALAALEAARPHTAGKQKKQVLSQLADMALGDGDLGKARGYFDQMLALDPNDVGTRRELADALAKHGRHEEALAEYQTAAEKLRADPLRRLEIMSRIGVELEALKKPDEAIAVYRKAIAETPRGHYLRKELSERIVGIYRKKEELKTLIALLEKEWPAGGRQHFEWDLFARLYEEVGDQDRALEAYRQAVKQNPYELETQRRLIALLERGGKEDEVLRQVEQVARVAPGEPRFQIDLAERYLKKGQRQKALALARQISARFGDDAGVHSALAELYSRWNEPKLALHEYETLVRIEPNDDVHLVNLGDQYFQRGDKAKADEIWRKIAAARTPEAYARLAEVYAEHDLGKEAVDTYVKALALRPRDAQLMRGMAAVLERQRQDDRALEAWNKVIELTAGDVAKKPLRREARARIVAILHRKPGSPLLARLREWQRRFEGRPPDLESGYLLIEGLLKLGRHEEARRQLGSLLAVDPKDLDAKHQLVAVLRNLRRYEEAVDLLKELAALEPAREREYFAQIAELELLLYHDAEAVRYAERVLEKSPKDPRAQEQLAEIFLKRGDLDKAAEAYGRAVELAPNNHKIRFALAKLQLRRGEHAEAARLYREIIRRANDEETLRSAARKAIDLEEYLGTLGELEKELAPLAFAPSSKGTYRRIIVEIYDRYVPPLVAKAKLGDDAASAELLRLGAHGLKPLLEALADAGDPVQQRIAVRTLGYLGNQNAAAPLTRFALELPEPGRETGDLATEMDLKVEALVAAGRLADPRVVPQLVKLATHREKAIREAAVWAIGRTRDRRGADTLIAVLTDPSSSIQALACVGLALQTERKLLDRVADAVKDSTRAGEARAACAWALGAARSQPHADVLAAALVDGSDDLQRKAAWSLGRIRDPKSEPALVAAYWRKKAAAREAILRALAPPPPADPTRLPFADDVLVEAGKIDYRQLVRDLAPEAPVRSVDPRVLRGRGKEVAAAIADVLEKGHRDLVLRVLRDLDARDHEVALGAFTQSLGDLPAADLAAVKQVIDQVGAAVSPRLVVLAAGNDIELRALALSILGKRRDPAAPALIVKALRADDPSVRLLGLAAAERILDGAADPEEITSAVIGLAAATSWSERTRAAVVLGRARGTKVEAALLKAARDDSGFVREAAARSLGTAAGTEAIEPLLTATSDDVPEVRAAAATSLRTHRADKRVRARLGEVAEGDPDARVRAAAQAANAP
jgi:tetratricopeptide (TPR) repeat protein